MATDLDLAKTVADLVADAELNILNLIRDQLAKGQESPQWAVMKLAELQEVRQQVISELRVLNADLAVSIEGVLSQAYMNGALTAYQGLTSAGIIAGLPSATNAALTALAGDITAKVAGLAPRVLRSTVDAYQQAVGASLGNLLLGTETRVQTTQKVIDRLLGQGITSFQDRAGRNWRLDTYTEMATRTGLGEARLLGHTQTLTDAGHDLVYVIPGPRACPDCDYWIGKVLSLTGATKSTPEVHVDATMEQARAAGHLFGPNCRCVTGIYLPGFTTLPTTHQDPGGYESQQKQRYFERRIREAKRQEALALTPEAKKAARAKVRERQMALRDHIDQNPGLKRQSHREQARALPTVPQSVTPVKAYSPPAGVTVPFTPDQRPDVMPKLDHILKGHQYGAGQGKSEFPQSWTPEKIAGAVDAVMADPQSIAKRGSTLIMKREVDGLEVTAYLRGRPGPGQLWTAFPSQSVE